MTLLTSKEAILAKRGRDLSGWGDRDETIARAQLEKVICEIRVIANKYEVVDDYSVLVEFRVAICAWLEAARKEIE